MIDRPEHIFRFLPIKYPTPTEDEYVQFWWDTYLKNLEQRNYHVAFLAFHLLYMTAVYYLLYKISKIHRLAYEHSLFHQPNDDELYYQKISSAFSFSKMHEKGVFRFLKVAGANHTLIGEVSKFIEDRNDAAHAKGVIFFKEDPQQLGERAVEYIKALEKIQALILNDAKALGQSWKVSKLTKTEVKLFLEQELAAQSLTPEELNLIESENRKTRPVMASQLSEIIETYYA